MDYWNREAKKAANHIGEHLFEAHRGAIAKPNGIVIIFGNDGYDSDERTRHEVEVVRHALSGLEPAPIEIGFAVCDDGYTWTLLFRAANGHDAEKVAAGATIAVWRAWQEASGGHLAGPFCELQYGIAQGVLEQHAEA